MSHGPMHCTNEVNFIIIKIQDIKNSRFFVSSKEHAIYQCKQVGGKQNR